MMYLNSLLGFKGSTIFLFVLQKGFETLSNMVPDLTSPISSKDSKSSVLFKSKYPPFLCILNHFHLLLNENFF